MSGHDPWCVVLDIDDTLYLERDYVRSGFAAVDAWVEEHLGVSGFGPRAWTAFERGTRKHTFNEVLDAMGLEPGTERIRAMVEVYRRHRPSIDLLSDARQCLEILTSRSPQVSLAVVTDGPAVSQRAKTTALNLSRWIERFVYTADLGPDRTKPHPEAFRLVQTGCAAQANQCVYLGDNPRKDFGGPQSLGWRTIRIRRAGGLHHDVPPGSDSDLVLPDMSSVPELLVTWGRP